MIKTILLSSMIVLSSSQIASTKKQNEVITKDTILPDSGDGSAPITVGTLLLGCGAIADRNDRMTPKLRTVCDYFVRYVIDYCDVHMTDSKAKQSLQVCWEKDIMDSAFYYALRHLNVDLDISGKHGKLVANRLNSEMGFR